MKPRSCAVPVNSLWLEGKLVSVCVFECVRAATNDDDDDERMSLFCVCLFFLLNKVGEVVHGGDEPLALAAGLGVAGLGALLEGLLLAQASLGQRNTGRSSGLDVLLSLRGRDRPSISNIDTPARPSLSCGSSTVTDWTTAGFVLPRACLSTCLR